MPRIKNIAFAPKKLDCPVCGRGFELTSAQRYYYRKNNPCRIHCSAECYHKNKVGENNPKWRGGETIGKGYVYVYCPEHPFATHHGYVLKHRLVMEEKIGRLLDSCESVHHLDGNKMNNAPDNLMLMPTEAEHRKLHIKYRTWDERGRICGHKEVAMYV